MNLSDMVKNIQMYIEDVFSCIVNYLKKLNKIKCS